jgi:pimeloyl-ACP methyl ester carboxylesterase
VDTNAANVLLTWNPASSVATNYLIERGIYKASSETYVYHQIASLNPATNSFKVTAPFTNANNWSDNYAIIPMYPGGVGAAMAVSPVNIGWTNGLAGPSSFYGYADGTGTNLVLAWTPAAGTPTNYVIFEGNTNSLGAFAYSKLAIVTGGTNTFTVTNGFNNLYADYAVFAVYTNGSQSQAAFWQSANGTPAPGNFVAYFDTTGASVWLSWTAPTGAITGYLVTRFDWNGEYFQATVGSTTTSYKDTNAVHTSSFDTNYTQYTVQATYAKGGVSSTAVASVGPLPTLASLSATLDATGKNVVVTWDAVPGAVDYVIDRGVLNPTTGHYSYSAIATVGSSVTSYVDTGAITGVNSYNNLYEVMAVFPGGVDSGYTNSAISESSAIPLNNVYASANLIRNGTGRWQVMFSGLPTNSTQTIRLAWTDANYNTSQQTISTASLTNGIFPIPDSEIASLLGASLTVQLFGPNGEAGQITYAGVIPSDAPYFVDGRQHMKQNLLFLIRAAGVNLPFGGTYFVDNDDPGYALNQTATNFEQFGFLHREYDWYWLSDQTILSLDDLWPFTLNYYLANNLVDTTRTNNPFGGTNFNFQINFANSQPAPPILSASPYYTLQTGFFGGGGDSTLDMPPAEWGLTIQDTQTVAILENNFDNVYNLPYQPGIIVDGEYGPGEALSDIEFQPGVPIYYHGLALGGSLTVPESNYGIGAYASQTATPTLKAISYYFAPLSNPDIDATNLPGEIDPEGSNDFQIYPLPVYDDFNVTNQTPPVIIGTVGQPMILGGWAKYSIQSGGIATGKYAYLGQYFVTNAFLLNSSGVATTNSAGVMSPYGEFFPLQAGVAQVATMPDIDSPYQQGTNFVRIISLNVDANHDGVMDLSYAGPDQTSASRPFRFWANDDQDSGDFGGNGGVPGYEPSSQADGYMLGQFETVPVFTSSGVKNFTDIVYNVHGRRDLVDFFPVYLNVGSLFQSNALSAGISLTDTNYQFVLSQSDGALRFVYTELTPTNYMNFLRDTNESGILANAIAWPIYPTGTVLNSIWITGTNNLFSDIATNNRGIILVEAATNTTQPLVLTIYHGTNQIAQTSLPLSISGVEQMFRSKTMLLEPDSRAVPDRLTDSAVPNEPDTTDTNFVFVHGYNVNPTQARGVAADIYKRMYWSGSHAKFWAVTWYGYDTQGSFGLPGLGDVTCDYQVNVDHAFNTASNLSVFLSSLPGGPITIAAHSLGNMVTLSALNDWNAPIANYFMMDAAVAIEAIDPSASPQPAMVYSSWASTNNYASRLYASYWWTMFTNSDARSTLTWSNRLGKLHNANVYNYYSSGEEVLRTNAADPPLTSIGATAASFANYFASHSPISSFVWVWQEKSKGVGLIDTVLGSTHGGWKFNTNAPYYYTNNGVLTHMPNSQASVLPVSQLQTNAFFDTSYDYLLFSPLTGSAYAELNGNRILSDAVPALTWPVGSNPVPKFTANDENIDMMTLENGWPVGRGAPRWPAVTTAFGEWHHSDFHEVAYTFTYHLFDQFVTVGNLK